MAINYLLETYYKTKLIRLNEPHKVTDHNVTLWLSNGGQHIDTVCWEISSLLGSVIDPLSPT